jgi:hypothetical protein
MSPGKPVRRIAIVGTGVIGASWATFYLARGFDVIATDPAPNAEGNLRHFVDTAWPALATLGVSPKASPEHLWFTADVRQASADADFIQENAPEHRELKISCSLKWIGPLLPLGRGRKRDRLRLNECATVSAPSSGSTWLASGKHG